MKLIHVAILLVIVNSSAVAQRSTKKSAATKPVPTSCNVKLADLPAIRGFHLGQHKSDIKIDGFDAAYAKAVLEDHDNPLYGTTSVHSFQIFPLGSLPPADFRDTSFTLHFFNERLKYFTIGYSEFDVPDIHEFIRQASPKVGLPAGAWRIVDKYSAEMRCDGFSVTLWTGRRTDRSFYQAEPQIAFSDDIADALEAKHRKLVDQMIIDAEEQRIQAKKEAERREAERRRVFKP